MSAAHTTEPQLARDLNVGHASAVVVGTIIGSGIFLVPSEMMQAVGSAKLVFLAWLVGGLLSFFGALTYAELGAMKPQAGGEYVYVRDAYGPLGGFLRVDHPADFQTCLDRDHYRRLRSHAGNVLGIRVLHPAHRPEASDGYIRSNRCHCGRRIHLAAELHRRKEGRRVPVALHDS